MGARIGSGQKMALAVNGTSVAPLPDGRLKLGALLVASGLVSQHQIEAALVGQRTDRRRLGEVLVHEGLLSETDLVEALAGQLRLEVVDLDQTYPSPAALTLLPRTFIVQRRVLPLTIDDEGVLVLAMTDPLDIVCMDEVKLRTKRKVHPVICTESAFDSAIATYLNTRGKLREQEDDDEGGVEDVALAHDASIIEIVDGLMSDAVSMQASDIHLEPHSDGLHLRCRIDGVMHELGQYPAELQPGIVSRIKIMGQHGHRRAPPPPGRPHLV